jgi:GTP-binding protein EngB required for normal cell division
MSLISKANCLQLIDALVGKLELVESNLALTMTHHVKQQSEVLLNKVDKIDMHINHLDRIITFHHDRFDTKLNIHERAIS